MKKELEKIIELEDVECPVCGTKDDKIILVGGDKINNLKGEFTVVQCQNCNLLRTNPRPTSSSIGYYYPESYAPYQNTLIGSKRKSGIISRIKYLFETKSQIIPSIPTGRMLEIGCASGAYLNSMKNNGWDVEGLEYSSTAALEAEKHGLKVYHGSLESNEFEYSRYDLVVGWMVLEHLHAPIQSLKKLYDATKPGGYLVLSIPNAGSYEFKLFKKHWYALHLPNHLFHFSPSTLKTVLEKAGWQVEKIHHQINLSSFLFSLNNRLEDKGYLRLKRILVGKSSDPIRLYHLLYPISYVASLFGQTGRMTVWAKK